jgi:hypothetical protein
MVVVKQLADFARLFDTKEVPFTSLLPKGRGWTVPDFCAKTKKQEVQPFMEYYQELLAVITAVRPEEDEEEWGSWQPSPSFTRLLKLANRIGQLAYQEVDNPVYDEAACLAWKEENMESWTKIEWGTSKLVDVSQST